MEHKGVLLVFTHFSSWEKKPPVRTENGLFNRKISTIKAHVSDKLTLDYRRPVTLSHLSELAVVILLIRWRGYHDQATICLVTHWKNSVEQQSLRYISRFVNNNNISVESTCILVNTQKKEEIQKNVKGRSSTYPPRLPPLPLFPKKIRVVPITKKHES